MSTFGKLYGYAFEEGEDIVQKVKQQFFIPNDLLCLLLALLLLLPIMVGVTYDPSIGWVLFGVSFIFAVIAGLDRFFENQRLWVVTNRRIFSREGFLRRKRSVISLDKITKESCVGGAFSHFLADGVVKLFTASDSKASMVICKQRAPQQIVALIRMAKNHSSRQMYSTISASEVDPLRSRVIEKVV